MRHRRKAREYALQILFQLDLADGNLNEILENFWKDKNANNKVVEFTTQLVNGTLDNKKEIDRLISVHSLNWKLERMSTVDRNVLRIAAYELHYLKHAPAPVIINEAIEVAKKYGSEDSAKFINGVLDAIRRSMEENGKKRTGKNKN
ncbi:MAG: transcription antitermination factor NusB [Candidatus Aminicenantia bacterium]